MCRPRRPALLVAVLSLVMVPRAVAQHAAGVPPFPPGAPPAAASANETAPAPGGAGAETGSGEESGFHFGTYGRVGIAWDGRDRTGQPFSVVSHGPRLEQPSYLELDFGYRLAIDDRNAVRALVTLAFFDDLFHFTGDLEQTVAIRNLYVETVLAERWTVWAGSRMLRGDDVYLFDWWPLDNLNTVGGGIGAAFGPYRVAVHAGQSRLDDEWQTQWFEVPDPVIGTDAVLTLDRPRTLASLRAERLWMPATDDAIGWKCVLYGEFHHVPSGTLRRPDLTEETLPDDLGWVVGAQGGLWTGDGDFLSLWVRAGGGLAAYGEMAVPYGFDTERRVRDATEFVLAAAGNLELEWFGLLGGAWTRWFRDADRNDYDPDDGWEFSVALRPHFYLLDWLHAALEVSYQVRRPHGLAFESGEAETPQIWKLAVMPMVVPLGNGTLSRPQFRLVYQISLPNDAARNTLPEDDPRRAHDVEHFVGLQVEWWHNSSYR